MVYVLRVSKRPDQTGKELRVLRTEASDKHWKPLRAEMFELLSELASNHGVDCGRADKLSRRRGSEGDQREARSVRRQDLRREYRCAQRGAPRLSLFHTFLRSSDIRSLLGERIAKPSRSWGASQTEHLLYSARLASPDSLLAPSSPSIRYRSTAPVCSRRSKGASDGERSELRPFKALRPRGRLTQLNFVRLIVRC